MKSGTQITIAVLTTALIVGGAAAALSIYDRELSSVEDADRITVTMPGKSAAGTYTSLYVWCIHDSIATEDHKSEPLGPVFGLQLISAYEAGDERVTAGEEGYYTVDLSDELPNGLSLSGFLGTGGYIGAIVSYSTEDLGSKIQSADVDISLSGDHKLTLPQSDRAPVEDEVTPYSRSLFGDFLSWIGHKRNLQNDL